MRQSEVSGSFYPVGVSVTDASASGGGVNANNNIANDGGFGSKRVSINVNGQQINLQLAEGSHNQAAPGEYEYNFDGAVVGRISRGV